MRRARDDGGLASAFAEATASKALCPPYGPLLAAQRGETFPSASAVPLCVVPEEPDDEPLPGLDDSTALGAELTALGARLTARFNLARVELLHA